MRFRALHTLIYIALLSISACATNDTEDQDARQSATTGAGGSASISPSDTSTGSSSTAGDDTRDRPSTANRRIVFLGDSITAGFGVDPDEAFPSLIQNRIDNLSLPFRVINSGISGDTSTGGLQRLPWLLRNRVDVLILELGGNDGLRGVDLALTYRNLSQIIEKTREKYPTCRIILAGMQVPPNLGHSYTTEFRSIFPRLASEYQTGLIPFLLDSVGGIPSLNQPDQIHPTAAGHQIVATTVWKALYPVLESMELEASSGGRELEASSGGRESE